MINIINFLIILFFFWLFTELKFFFSKFEIMINLILFLTFHIIDIIVHKFTEVNIISKQCPLKILAPNRIPKLNALIIKLIISIPIIKNAK